MSSNFYFEYCITYSPIVTDKEFVSLKQSLHTIDPLIDILFESMVIQLYKFFELHRILTKCLKDSSKIGLLSALKKPWNKIDKSASIIRIWRNEIISHSRNQSINYIPYHVLDPNYNESRKFIVSVSRYAVIYIWAIIDNIHTDYMSATLTKEEDKNSLVRVEATEVLSQTIINERKFWKEVNEELKKDKYKPVRFCGYEKWPMNPASIQTQ
jgi:hypothetical protein